MQVIFTGIPIWSSLIAIGLLGEAPLSPPACAGAALIIAAGLVIALDTTA